MGTENRKANKQFPDDWDCRKEQSVGLYQINLFVHQNITYEQAIDNEFNADWTAKRLLSKGYKTNKLYAIQAHNGITGNYNYANRVLAISKTL